MVCKITSTKKRKGFTLVELLVSLGIGGLALAALAALTFYTGRSFAALANYVDLDSYSRNALDQMSKEIRQTSRLLEYSPTKLVFENWDLKKLSYVYDNSGRTLNRYVDGVQDGPSLLKDCDYLNFSIYQRNPISGTYDQYPTATPATCKLVQLRWVCSRDLVTSKWNTESVQSAKIVIRKQ
jgi:prepilin-type N-terminal cleavage/methylation domain-containing protein